MNRLPQPLRLPAAAGILLLLWAAPAAAQSQEVPVDSDRWTLVNAERIERLGRPCIAGRAMVKEADFQDGTIEAEIAVSGTRSYPGFLFRVQSPTDYERVYIRPHRPNLYGDVLQYTPSIHGISGWQLYSGPGFTAGADLVADEWMHLRLEFRGKQARLFVNDAEQPSLVVYDLQHGVSKGGIGIDGPRDASACFANFRYTPGGEPTFDPPPPVDRRPGMIRDWQLSQVLPVTEIDADLHPADQELPALEWRAAVPDPSGLVDVARYSGRSGRIPDAVYAKTTIHSDEEVLKKYRFGYSDSIAIYLNGRILFTGESAYRQRDPSFLGIVGLNDAIHLPLKRGDNELLILVVESFGGWGFMFQEAETVFTGGGVAEAWETPEEFLVPESVAYDPARDVFYVSSFDALGRSTGEDRQFVSRLSPDGTILARKWITGLARPTGLAVSGDRLWAVERGSLVEIDIESGELVRRHPIPGAAFPNDVTVDEGGAVYVSDSGGNKILRMRDGAFEVWLEGPEVAAPNGIHVAGDKLVWGNNGDGRLKIASLASKEIVQTIPLGSGIIDGVQTDAQGNYLVSHWEGRIFRITPSGEVRKIVDTTAPEAYSADFGYAAERRMLAVPTFYGNTVKGYTLPD